MFMLNPSTMPLFNGIQTIPLNGNKSDSQSTINLQAASNHGGGDGSEQEATHPIRGNLREGTTGKWFGVVSLLAALFASSAALADCWDLLPETAENPHPAWICKPNSTLEGSNLHGLMVVLHGCDQTHGQLKKAGNLEKAAENQGLVIAIPYVTEKDGYLFGCWNYNNGTADNSGHVAEIIALTTQLKLNHDLNIDPKQVYVVGLSSGGALALKLGCKAPDLFAGIGAIAGPSVGSDQMQATADKSTIPINNVSNATNTCQSLAGDKQSFFATQIANIAYGTMDLNGPDQKHPCSFLDQKYPGQNCLASIRWSKDNIEILQTIYGTGSLGSKTDLQGGKGTEESATTNRQTRLSLVVIPNVGHAWPAGKGIPNDPNNQYVAQQGLNYPQYIAEWLIKNNIRGGPQVGPVVTVNKPLVSNAEKNLTVTGNVSGQDINKVDTVLERDDGTGHFEKVGPPREVASAAGDFTVTYPDLTSGSYQVTATATDVNNRKGSATTEVVVLGWRCTESHTSNYEHVSAGRAYDVAGIAYAKGSNDRMGLDNTFYQTKLAQTKKDYFVAASCPY